MSRYEFDKHLSASLNVDNLFDKKYYDNVGSTTACTGATRAR